MWVDFLFSDFFPQLFNGFIIGRLGGQIVNSNPAGFSREEFFHSLTGVVYGPVLYEDNVFSGFGQDFA